MSIKSIPTYSCLGHFCYLEPACRDLCTISLKCSKLRKINYNCNTIDRLAKYLTDSDKDVREAAKKRFDTLGE